MGGKDVWYWKEDILKVRLLPEIYIAAFPAYTYVELMVKDNAVQHEYSE